MNPLKPSRKRYSHPLNFLAASLGFSIAAISVPSARAASQTWDGEAATTSLNDAANWTNDEIPAAGGDIATWDGTVPGDLSLTWTAFGSGFGTNGVTINVAGGHTGSLKLDAAAATGDLSVGTITIAAGAGAFTLGDGSGTANVVLRTAAAPNANTFTNNSNNNATISSDVVFGSASAADRIVTFTGSGNWVVNNAYNAARTAGINLGIIKDGAGTLFLNNAANSYNQGTTVRAGTVILGAGDTSTTVGVLGGSSRSVLLGDTAGSNNASLLNAGFSAGNAITVQTGSTGTITLGGSAANASIFSGNILLGSTDVAAKDAKFVAAAGGTVTFSGIIAENLGATTSANVVVGDSTNTGTVVFSNAANTYTGTTTINGGKLSVTGTLTGVGAVAVNGGAALAGSGSIAGAVTVAAGNAAAGQGAIDLRNGATGTLSISGGLTIGGASAGLISNLKFDVLASTADLLALGTGTFTVGVGGAPISITNLGGISAGQTINLLTFANGTGAGFAVGSGTTVGSLTLTTPNLSFGVTGSLNVTGTAVQLVTTGAAAPATAYWRGIAGATWSATNGGGGNFTTDAAGTTQVQAYPSGSTDVIFSASNATNLTNTLGQNFAVRSVTFGGTNAVTIGADGNTLTIGSGGLNVPAGVGAVTIAANLGGTGAVTNANLLTLSGNSPSFTGGVVNTGTLTFGSATALSANSNLAANAGTVNLNGNNVTVGALSGNSGAVITNLAAGTATLTASNASDSTYDGLLKDGGAGQVLAFTNSGTATLTLTGANSYTGTTTVSAGTLAVQGTNSSAGATKVSGGVLQLGNAANGGLASGPLSLNGGALEAVNAARTLANATTLDADSTISGALDLTLNGIFTISASRTLNSNLTGASLTLSNTVSNSGVGTATLTVADVSGSNTVISGTVENGTGTFAFTKSGGGTVTLSGSNTYSGTTTVQGGATTGILNITGSNSGGGIYNVGDQSTLSFNPSGTVEASSLNFVNFSSIVNLIGGTVNVAGSVTSTNVSNSRFLNLNGGVLQVGTSVFSATTGVIVNFNGGTLKSGNGGGLTFESTTTTTTSDHTVTVQTGGATLDTTNGNITSTAVFNGIAGGAITIKGGNTFTSNVTNSGVFTIENNSIWDMGSTGGANAVFLNSSVGGLSGNGIVDNSSGINGTLTIDFEDFVGPFTYSGNIAPVLANGIALVKNGSGTQILSGANTYTGTTTVNAGTLLVGGSISGSATTVEAAGTIGAGSAANAIGTGTTGTLTFSGTGTFQLDLNITSASVVTNDLLNVIGDLNLDGDLSPSGDAILALQNIGPDIALNPGTSFTFIDYSGLWDGKTFAGLSDDSVFSLGANLFRISYNGVSGTDTAVTLTAVVPEPNGAVMLLGGLGLLHLGRRRSRRASSRNPARTDALLHPRPMASDISTPGNPAGMQYAANFVWSERSMRTMQ